MLINGNLPLRFKSAELQYFNWLFSVAPCFPINAGKINIITDPRKFYDSLHEKFKTATRRISVASLYIGTGPLEKDLLKVTKQNVLQNKSLKFSVLLDYQRGTRGVENSRSLLQEFLTDVPEQCTISLYQTPRLQGSWSKALPSRYNELVGLQHMKLYIADDSVLLSGANCSNDYFQERQDRYIEIHDPNLANFYCELIDEVSKYSKKCVKNGYCAGDGHVKHGARHKRQLTQEVNEKIINFIQRWKHKQESSISCNDPNKDTWVFPLIQMGEYDIRQDERVTQGLLGSAPRGSLLRLATGYFNVTGEYADTLLNHCKADISLLMAHPNANGFLGAAGPAGGIPNAYSLIARKFWDQVEKSNQTERVQMLEYERPNWTFHAKGLWYYPPGSAAPWATVVGSANLGERSVKRDLEAQAAIFTVSPDLQEKLHEECSKLHEYSSECVDALRSRAAPLWIRATVGLFRSYF